MFLLEDLSGVLCSFDGILFSAAAAMLESFSVSELLSDAVLDRVDSRGGNFTLESCNAFNSLDRDCGVSRNELFLEEVDAIGGSGG